MLFLAVAVIYTNDGELLDAATGVSYEVGTKWELMDERLFPFQVRYLILLQENISMDVEDTSSGDWTKTQGGEQVHRGAELAAQGFISEKFSMSGSANVLRLQKSRNHETYEGKPSS